MTKTTYNNPYHPYPYEMRGQCVERKENNKTRFFQIFSLEYDEKYIERLKEIDALEHSDFGRYLGWLNRPITDSDNVFYLYKFETYYADPNQEDLYLFNKSIDCYEAYVFQNIDELFEYANHKWGLVLSDFVQKHKTHIPSY